MLFKAEERNISEMYTCGGGAELEEETVKRVGNRHYGKDLKHYAQLKIFKLKICFANNVHLKYPILGMAKTFITIPS